MRLLYCSIFFLFACKTNLIFAQQKSIDTTNVKAPKFRFIKNVPYDIKETFIAPFKKENKDGILGTITATGVLLLFDETIAKNVQQLCTNIHLSNRTYYKVPIHIGKTDILKLPQNFNSAFYQWGEGGTSMLIAGGLYVYGKMKHDVHAVHTASDITETFITMGIATQLIKRVSGRESPSRKTILGGAWRPLPSFSNYQKHTPKYDAFPSGHLATMMATVTTLHLNYPHSKLILPIGYGLMTLTSLAMINTNVHWASDYPLALALGYISAKITNFKNKPKQKKSKIIL
jgi:hypothetical protein